MTPSFDPAVKEYTLLVPDSTNAVYAWATRGADLSTKASIKATWTSMEHRQGFQHDAYLRQLQR